MDCLPQATNRFSSNHETTNVIVNSKWCQRHDLPHSTKIASTTALMYSVCLAQQSQKAFAKDRTLWQPSSGKTVRVKRAMGYSYPLQNSSSTLRNRTKAMA